LRLLPSGPPRAPRPFASRPIAFVAATRLGHGLRALPTVVRKRPTHVGLVAGELAFRIVAGVALSAFRRRDQLGVAWHSSAPLGFAHNGARWSTFRAGRVRGVPEGPLGPFAVQPMPERKVSAAMQLLASTLPAVSVRPAAERFHRP